jgi:hypothetical protein
LGFLAEALVRCLAVKSAVRAVVVVVVLPLLQLLGEEVGVVDDLAFEESVELFGVDAVGSLHFAVQPGCPRFDLDVVNAFVEQVPVERGAEFGSVEFLTDVKLRRLV